MALSTYAGNKVVDLLTGKAAFSTPTVYVGLLADGGTELSGNGYARVETSASDWNSADAKSTTNAATIEFPEASGTWTEAVSVATYDAATAGNQLGTGDLDTPTTIAEAEIARFPIGDLTITAT